jgi:hypothetical protein
MTADFFITGLGGTRARAAIGAEVGRTATEPRSAPGRSVPDR